MQLYTRSADPFEKIDDPTHHGAARDTIFPLEYSSAHMSRSILRPQRLDSRRDGNKLHGWHTL